MTHSVIWKDVPDFPPYEVSNYGQVRNRLTGRMLKTPKNNWGYLCLTLRKNNRAVSWLLHRLVAYTFITTDIDGFDVNHEDGNKDNCSIGNLTVVTKVENSMHAFRTGLQPKHSIFQPTPLRDVASGEIFESTSAAARSAGTYPAALYHAVKTDREINGRKFEKVA